MAEIDAADLHTSAVGMTKEEIDRALSRAVLGRIATAGADMQPHVVPIWFWWDGESMYIETGPGFRKARNLAENPRCAVIVDETQGGLRFWGIFMTGKVELITEPADWVRDIVRRIYLRYLGTEGILASTPQKMINSEHVIIKFTPSRFITWDDTRTAIAPVG